MKPIYALALTLAAGLSGANADAKDKAAIDVSMLDIEIDDVRYLGRVGVLQYHDFITGNYEKYNGLAETWRCIGDCKQTHVFYDARNDSCIWVVPHPIIELPDLKDKNGESISRTLSVVVLDKGCDDRVEAMADVLYLDGVPKKVFDEKKRKQIPRLNGLEAALKELKKDERNEGRFGRLEAFRNEERRKQKQNEIQQLRIKNKRKWDKKYR